MICNLVKNVYNIPALPFIVDCDDTPWLVEEIDPLPNLMQAFSIFKMFWASYTQNAILQFLIRIVEKYMSSVEFYMSSIFSKVAIFFWKVNSKVSFQSATTNCCTYFLQRNFEYLSTTFMNKNPLLYVTLLLIPCSPFYI